MVCDIHWRPAVVSQMVEKRLAHTLAIKESDVWGGVYPANGFQVMLGNTDGMPREVLRLAVNGVKEAIQNGHNRVTEEDMSVAIRSFSENRIDDLASDTLYSYPNLRLAVQEFSGGRKEFDIEYLREVSFRLGQKAETLNAHDCDWAVSGLEDPLEFAKRLMRSGFLWAKDGRDAKAKSIDHDDVELIDTSYWFAIHPMYHVGLGLEGT